MQEIMIKHNPNLTVFEDKRLLNLLDDICCSYDIKVSVLEVSDQITETYINGELKMKGSFPTIKDLSFWCDEDLESLISSGCACGSGGCQCH